MPSDLSLHSDHSLGQYDVELLVLSFTLNVTRETISKVAKKRLAFQDYPKGSSRCHEPDNKDDRQDSGGINAIQDYLRNQGRCLTPKLSREHLSPKRRSRFPNVLVGFNAR